MHNVQYTEVLLGCCADVLEEGVCAPNLPISRLSSPCDAPILIDAPDLLHDLQYLKSTQR